MGKGRLEAFSDGVIAIIITITVLLIEPPKGENLPDLTEILPLVLVYTVSFIMIGTNRANHHHLLKVTDHINCPDKKRLPFPFMGWVECIANTAWDWQFSGILNNVTRQRTMTFPRLSRLLTPGRFPKR